MADLVFGAFIALGAVSGLSLLVLAIRRYPLIGVAGIASSVLLLWEFPTPPPIATVAGLQIYFNDLAGVSLFVVGLLNIRNLHARLGRSLGAWVLLGALIAVSLLRGVLEYGAGQSVNEARSILWTFFAFSWALSVDWSTRDFPRIVLLVGTGLSIVAVYHGVVYGVGDSGAAVTLGDSTRTGRLLVSTQALALALCAIMLLLTGRERTRLARVSGWVFLLIAVVSQHRSVWVALAVGVIAVAVMAPRSAGRTRAWGLAFATAFASLVIAASGILGDLVQGIVNSATDFGTIMARSTSWAQLVEQLLDEGLFSVLFGLPFGWGFVRIEPNGLVQTYSPHNWYVLLLLRVGIIGLAAWTVVVIRAILRVRRSSSTGLFALVAVSAFGMFYSVPWQIAPLVGVALATTRREYVSRPHIGTEEPSIRVGTSPGLRRFPLGTSSIRDDVS